MAGGKIREIKRRIKTTTNMKQMTKAMEMVSTSKYKKYNKLVLDSRPYLEGMRNIIKDIGFSIKEEKNPLFDERKKINKIAIIVVTSDKGLCGGYNANILRALETLIIDNKGSEIEIISIGKKIKEYCKKSNIASTSYFLDLNEDLAYDIGKNISIEISENFIEEKYDKVLFVSTEFISALNSTIKIEKLLPLDKDKSNENRTLYFFEPTENTIFDDLIHSHVDIEDNNSILTSLLPKYLNVIIYQGIMESLASEYASRMRAMKNATENAKENISKLTLKYNRERQSIITQEILEIVSGAEALK